MARSILCKRCEHAVLSISTFDQTMIFADIAVMGATPDWALHLTHGYCGQLTSLSSACKAPL